MTTREPWPTSFSPGMPLDEVLQTHQLRSRPSRPPNYQADADALRTLAIALAGDPSSILQKLTEVSLSLCGAGSAGVSLIHEATGDFWWPAIAGAWTSYIGQSMPRDFSPCAHVLDRRSSLLFCRLARHYTYLKDADPPLVEVLLAPFGIDGKILGTVWVILHNDARQFDAEDERRLTSIATFAAAAYQAWRNVQTALQTETALRETESRFRALVTTTSDIVYRMSPDWSVMRYLDGRDFIADTPEPSRTWIDKYIPIDEQTLVRKTIAEAVRDKKMFQLEHRVLRADGSIGWTFSRAIPILNDGGEIIEWFGSAGDVTPRKEAEALLRSSEERMRSFADSAPAMLWVTEDDGYCTFLSRGWYDFTGQTVQEAIGFGWANAAHPNDRERAGHEFVQAVKARIPFRSDYRLRRVDGEYRHVIDLGHPRFSPAGDFVGYVGSVIDVTEQYEVESKYRLLVHLDDVTRTLSDPQEITQAAAAVIGRHLGVNRCAYADVEADQNTFNLTGDYTHNVPSIVGRYTFDQFGDECLRLMRADKPYIVQDSEMDPRTERVRDAYRATQIRSVICVPIHKDGRFVAAMAVHQLTPRVWTSAEVDLVRAVAARCWESIERTRVTRNLHESERRLRLSQKVARIGSFEWFIPEDRIIWTPELEELYGVPVGTFEGSFEHWAKRVNADDYARVNRDIQQALAAHKESISYEFRIFAPSGAERWLRGEARFDYDAAGRPARMIGVNIDIDEQKRAADILQLHRERLEQLVVERTAALEASHRKLRLSERMASLGTLSAGLGHDMGNLLVPVRIRLETLAKADLPEEIKADLKAIGSATDYMRKLSSGLRMLVLDPERSAAGEQTDVAEWWADAEPMLKSAVPRGVQLTGSVDPGACVAHISRPALTQSVFNLVQNAGDALRGSSSGRVHITASSDGTTVRLAITDNGPGMTTEVKAHCMDPYFTTKPRDISTGLGLVLVYGLIKDAGGSVQLESELGKGTTFTLVIPAASTNTRTRHAVVSIKDARLRALAISELQVLGYAINTESEQAADVYVVDDPVRVQGMSADRPIVLLGAAEHFTRPSTVAIGAKPGLPALRDAIRSAALGKTGGAR